MGSDRGDGKREKALRARTHGGRRRLQRKHGTPTTGSVVAAPRRRLPYGDGVATTATATPDGDGDARTVTAMATDGDGDAAHVFKLPIKKKKKSTAHLHTKVSPRTLR
eukprot:TRINITY_DN1434_c0_g3_i1.p1 TRINITY_DN1434_c0_g3~~TRINITY_DN1434_c0_g3_i1.p1  ORF type:complete len:108 (+),score=17.21 TRINITY_DN1434_c0_g3_i1:47-370(+)